MEYRTDIDKTFKDEKRNLTIIDKEIRTRYNKDNKAINEKWYKYHCNVCGWDEGWIREGDLLHKKYGCSCCHNLTVVEGINDIPTTAPWMVKYFQGGYDEAKLYSKNSGVKIKPICPDCGRIKDKKIQISKIYNAHSIMCSCSDKTPYSEKIMNSVLDQLNIDFQTQLNKTTFSWCKNYRYDFYFELNNEQYIIETHGLQHYEEQIRTNARSLLKEQENDRVKKDLALSNGIKKENYIIIDCRYSDLNWIKDNENGILNSKLAELFDLSKIDWNKVLEFSLTNLIKIACKYKKNNPDMTTVEIGEIIGYKRGAVSRWLKKGNEIGWCDYNSKEESVKASSKNGKSKGKQVEIFKDGISLGIFKSCTELETQSEKLFGIKLNISGISMACNRKRKEYKGFMFKYI